MIDIKTRKDKDTSFTCVDIAITRGDSAYLTLNIRDRMHHPILISN